MVSINNRMSDHEYEMISDGMNAIEISNCENWVNGFEGDSGFMFSSHPNLTLITNNMQYGGHSGCSFAMTMRRCQYFLSNTEEWNDIKQQFNDNNINVQNNNNTNVQNDNNTNVQNDNNTNVQNNNNTNVQNDNNTNVQNDNNTNVQNDNNTNVQNDNNNVLYNNYMNNN
jgi:hypothetical protein